MSYCPSCFEIKGTCACGPVASPKKPAKAPRAKAGPHKRPAAAAKAPAAQNPKPQSQKGFGWLLAAIAVILAVVRELGWAPASEEEGSTWRRAMQRNFNFEPSQEQLEEAKLVQAAIDVSPLAINDRRARDWQTKVNSVIFYWVAGQAMDWKVLSAAVWGWEKQRQKAEAEKRSAELIAQLEDGNTPELAMVAAEIMADKAKAGESVEINVDVVSSAGFNGRFGHSYVMKGRCDGLAVTWFSTRETKAGTTVLVRGKPEYRVYRGVGEWLLKRPKVLKVVEV